jgi:hypothetical protein
MTDPAGNEWREQLQSPSIFLPLSLSAFPRRYIISTASAQPQTGLTVSRVTWTRKSTRVRPVPVKFAATSVRTDLYFCALL